MKGIVKGGIVAFTVTLMMVVGNSSVYEVSQFGTFLCCLYGITFGWGDSE